MDYRGRPSLPGLPPSLTAALYELPQGTYPMPETRPRFTSGFYAGDFVVPPPLFAIRDLPYPYHMMAQPPPPPPPCFPLMLLPIELRLQIWAHATAAIPARQTTLFFQPSINYPHRPILLASSAGLLPQTLSICRESRQVAQESYELVDLTTSRFENPRSFHVDFDKDVVAVEGLTCSSPTGRCVIMALLKRVKRLELNVVEAHALLNSFPTEDALVDNTTHQQQQQQQQHRAVECVLPAVKELCLFASFEEGLNRYMPTLAELSFVESLVACQVTNWRCPVQGMRIWYMMGLLEEFRSRVIEERVASGSDIPRIKFLIPRFYLPVHYWL